MASTKEIEEFFAGAIQTTPASKEEIDDFFTGATQAAPASEKEVEEFFAGAGTPKEVESPTWVTTPISDAEIKSIAQKYGVDAEELGSFAAARGGIREYKGIGDELTEAGKQLAGELGQTLAFGAPQKLSQLAQTPEMQKAIDDLNVLLEEKKSTLQASTELVGRIAGGIASGQALGKVIPAVGAALSTPKGILASGAATGAVSGAAGAKSGEELEGAATGTAVGLGLGALGVGMGKLLGRTKAPTVPAATGDVAEEAAESAINAEKALRDAFGEKESQQIYKELEERVKRAAPELDAKRWFINKVQEIDAEDLGSAKVDRMLYEAFRSGEEIPEAIVRKVEAALPTHNNDVDRALNSVVRDEASFLREFAYYVKYGKQFGQDAGQSSIKHIKESKEGDRVSSIFKEMNPQEVQNKLNEFATLKEATEGPLAVRLRTLGGRDMDAVDRILDKIRDSRYVAASVDRVHPNLNATAIIDSGSMRTRAHTLNVANWLGEAKAQEARKLLTEVPAWEKLSQHVVDAIEQGRSVKEQLTKYAEIDEEVKNALLDDKTIAKLETAKKNYEEVFAELFDKANQKSLDLNGTELIKGARERYVPAMAVSPVEAVAKINSRIRVLKRVGVDLLSPEMMQEQVSKLPTKQRELAEQIIRSVEYLTGREQSKVGSVDMDNFRLAYSKLQKPETLHTLDDVIARASLRRVEDSTTGIPRLIRETRLPVLAQRWVSNSSRAIHLAQPLAQLRDARNFLVAVGDKRGATWADNLIKDIAGRGRDTPSSAFGRRVEQVQVKLLDAAQDYPEKSVKRKVLEGAAEFPTLVNFMMSQMYPSFLGGANLISPLVNMSTIMMYTVPEIGYVYGSKMATQSYLQTVQKLFKQGFVLKDGSRTRSITKYLEDAGFKGAEVTTLAEVFQDETLKNVKLRKARELIDKGNQKLMFLFEKSEELNKAVALQMADNMAADLLKKRPQRLLDFAKRMQEGPRRELLEAAQEQNYKKAQDVLRKYLVGKTLLNYDKLNAAELARDVGPLMSMFTRWPTAVAGDVMEQFEMRGWKGGSGEVARKLLAPLFLMMALNEATDSEVDLTRLTPASSLKGMVGGQFASPPVLKIPAAAGQAALGDWDKAEKNMKDFVRGAIPFGAVIRDMITLFEGEE